jgi:hypothetical protein
MLKDHGVYPDYISKEEIALLFKYLNIKLGHKSETNIFEYSGYL